MFGKPQWFRPKRIGWGLTPITWQGWSYLALWTAVIILPFIVLMVRNQVVEAIFWEVITISALTADVWKILKVLPSNEVHAHQIKSDSRSERGV